MTNFLPRVLAILCLLTQVASAADTPGLAWPQFLGPARDGTYAGPIAWPAGGPKTLWQIEAGQGWSAPVIADGKVLLFHRVADKEVLDCLDLLTGKLVWSSNYGTAYVDGFGFDAGPRATPAIADGRVFTFGAEGSIHAFEWATGKQIWAVDAARQFQADKGFFGFACSPLVSGKKLFVSVGGRAGGLVALDVKSGKTLWTSTQGEAGYSSPVLATVEGKPCVLAFLRSGLLAASEADGAVVFQFPWRSRMDASVNAATPLVKENEVFISASYGTGAALLNVSGHEPKTVWSNDDSMSNHYATCVRKDDLLFGFHGRQEQGPELRCIEWKTGKVAWTQRGLGTGTLTRVGDQLLILLEKGQLVLVNADGTAFKEIGRKQILGFDTRAYPALASGLLVARGKDKLVCVDLRPPSK